MWISGGRLTKVVEGRSTLLCYRYNTIPLLAGIVPITLELGTEQSFNTKLHSCINPHFCPNSLYTLYRDKKFLEIHDQILPRPPLPPITVSPLPSLNSVSEGE